MKILARKNEPSNRPVPVHHQGDNSNRGEGRVLMVYPTYRFPKWLYAETYSISHDASTPGHFIITLVRGNKRLIGVGATITQAAKRASESSPTP